MPSRHDSARFSVRVAALAIALACLAGPAAAQDRLFIGTGEIGAFGRFGERIGNAPGAVHGQFVAGGRFVASRSQVFDTLTGQAMAVSGGTIVGVDPRRPRVFVHDGTTLGMFDLETRAATPLAQVVPIWRRDVPTPMVHLAADVDELFVLRQSSGGGPLDMEIAVIDLTTRSETRRFALPAPEPFDTVHDWRVDADGAGVVILRYSTVTKMDGRSGALVASAPLASSSSGRLVDDRLNRRFYVAQQRLLSAFDDALRPIGAVPLRSSCAPSSLVFSHHTGRLYVVESEGGHEYYGRPIPIQFFLSAIDAASGRRLATREVTRAAGVPAGSNSCAAMPMSVVTAPGPPAGLTATVSGHDVTLAWSNVGDAATFVVDVGLTPGRTDLTFSIGSSSPATIAGAPSGTYYLRVRGTNVFGVSRPSSEVVVTVP